MYTDYKIIFDIDGTLCPIKNINQEYKDLIPYKNMIEKIKLLRESGAKIVLFSSRNMNSYNSNIGLINKNTIPVLIDWLKKWDIPYDELYIGKPWPGNKGFYVDDRAVRPNEFLKYSIEELEDLMNHCKVEE